MTIPRLCSELGGHVTVRVTSVRATQASHAQRRGDSELTAYTHDPFCAPTFVLCLTARVHVPSHMRGTSTVRPGTSMVRRRQPPVRPRPAARIRPLPHPALAAAEAPRTVASGQPVQAHKLPSQLASAAETMSARDIAAGGSTVAGSAASSLSAAAGSASSSARSARGICSRRPAASQRYAPCGACHMLRTSIASPCAERSQPPPPPPPPLRRLSSHVKTAHNPVKRRFPPKSFFACGAL